MRTSRWWVGVLLVLLLTGSACTQREPEAVETSRPPTPLTALTSESPSASASLAPSTLEAVLPDLDQLGDFSEYSSCFARDQLCSTSDGGPDPELSWVRASSGLGGSPAYDWAEVRVSRQPARGHVRRVLRDARRQCPLQFVVPAEPRGFFPRPEALAGTSRRQPVELAEFRGTHCASRTVSPDTGRMASHRILVARDDVRVLVSARGRGLTFRLLREYVGRLSPR